MDLDRVLLWLTAGTCAFLLIRLAQVRFVGRWGWAVVYLVILAIDAIGYLMAPDYAGRIGRDLCARSQVYASVRGRANPAVLPGGEDGVVVTAVADVGAVAVADLDGLARREGDGSSDPDARALLAGRGI